jgi:hypothetical protein
MSDDDPELSILQELADILDGTGHSLASTQYESLTRCGPRRLSARGPIGGGSRLAALDDRAEEADVPTNGPPADLAGECSER